MSIKVVNRVVETTQTTGTGTLDLGGAQTGYRAFSDELTSGDQVFYCIEDDPSSPTVFEYGYGTWTSGSPATLSRDTVIGSSNGGSKISLQSGTTYTVTGALVAGAGKTVGRVAQVVNTETGALATGTTTIPADDTIPQNTEGDQYMSLSITPTDANSTLLVDVCFIGALSAVTHLIAALFQDSGTDAIAAAASKVSLSGDIQVIRFQHKMIAGTASPTTFKVRAGGGNAATLTFNGFASGRIFGGVMASSITITEFLP